MEKTDIMLCECYSPEHQMIVHYDSDEDCKSGFATPMCYIHIHLNKLPFWERVKYGVKYILGRQCSYGAFDEFIINPKDVNKFENIVSHLKK